MEESGWSPILGKITDYVCVRSNNRLMGTLCTLYLLAIVSSAGRFDPGVTDPVDLEASETSDLIFK